VGEGKKFKTIEDLAKAKLESDAFILRLQDEQKGLRDDLNNRVRLEELLEALENRQDGGTENSGNNQSRNNSPDANSPDLETIIEDKLTKREAARTASENTALVEQTIKDYFGDDYKTKLQARMRAEGVDEALATQLAKTNPRQLFKLLGMNTQRQDQTPTVPTSRTNVPLTPNQGQRNYKFYSDLRKSDPSRYWAPDVQLQLHKDAIAAANRGEDFYKQ